MILGVITDDYYPQQGHRWGGTGWARIGKYLPYLPEDWDIHVASQIWPADQDGLSITDRHGKRVWPDVIWCQRVFMPGFATEVMHARSVGQRVVTDLDDLLWEVPKGSLADTYWTGEQILGFIQTLTVSDVVTCSTKWLSSRLFSEFKIPSLIIPNTIDVEHFDQVKQRHGTPYLGWTGCPAVRPGDLEIMQQVFPELGKMYKYQHSGHLEGWPTFAEKTWVKPDKILDAVHPNEFPSLLDFHVGIVPLTLHNFNRAKSDIKGIEYAAAGIPFVASSLPAYKQLQKDWGDVVRLARTTEDWVKHLTELRDFQTRQDEGNELRKLAWKRDIPTATQELKHVLLG